MFANELIISVFPIFLLLIIYKFKNQSNSAIIGDDIQLLISLILMFI